MEIILKLVLGFSVLTSLFLTSSAQTCKSYKFNNNQVFSTCRDLPHLSSYLHWTYNQSTGQLHIAYRHTGITSTNKWVAWAINPKGTLNSAMLGAQALVAIPQSSGTPKVYTSAISSYSTQLQESNLSFPVSGLSATYQNSEVTIFATLSLNRSLSNITHTWQEGDVSGSTPQAHAQNSDNLNAKETLDLASGQSDGSGGSTNTSGSTNSTNTSSTQACNGYTFANNKVFTTCSSLPYLSSYLYWTYDQSSGKLDLAYRHSGITSTNKWVAWALNPSGTLNSAMLGAQALVAITQSSGSPKVYTSAISSYSTQLQESNLSFPVSGLSATYQNNEVVIYATLTLSGADSSMIHTWQEGDVSGSTPQVHAQNSDNLNAKETLNFVSGQSEGSGGSANSLRRRRNVHGMLNAVSWGILMPMGAIIARYLKVFKSADPAWFYLHVTCQTSAYILGVAGWGTGLKLGSDSVGIEYTTHRRLGIVLFCLGTLQMFALLLRPKKDHKFRFYWNVYHHLIGYTIIIISIINIFKGFSALEQSVQDRYNDYKHAYIGIIAALGGIAVLLEAYTWIIVLKRRKSESKTSNANGVNGYGSRPSHV